jgi:hypothetical protein
MTSDGVITKFVRELAVRKEAEAADADRHRKRQIKNANQHYDFELQRIDGKLEARGFLICGLNNLTVPYLCFAEPQQQNLRKTSMNIVIVRLLIRLQLKKEIIHR